MFWLDMETGCRWESVFIVRTVAEMHQAILVRKDHPLSRLEKVSDNDIMVILVFCRLRCTQITTKSDVFQENLGWSRPQRYHTDDFQTMLAIV